MISGRLYTGPQFTINIKFFNGKVRKLKEIVKSQTHLADFVISA